MELSDELYDKITDFTDEGMEIFEDEEEFKEFAKKTLKERGII